MVNNSFTNLRNVNIDTTSWYPILIFLCGLRLPKTLFNQFEDTLEDNSEIPQWKTFDAFLTHRHKYLDAVGNLTDPISINQPDSGAHIKPMDRKFNTFHAKASGAPISSSSYSYEISRGNTISRKTQYIGSCEFYRPHIQCGNVQNFYK